MSNRFSLGNDPLISFLKAAGMGAYSNVSVIHKFGSNPAVGSTFETIWGESSLYVYRSSAIVMKVASSSTDDDASGTGALTVKIEGLDANYAELSETVVLDGQTSVDTVGLYLRVFRMEVLTAGSGGSNAGIVYAGTGAITSGKPAVVHGLISVGYNQSLMGMYTIPAGKTGFIHTYEMSSSITKATTARIVVREQGSIFKTKAVLSLTVGGISHDYEAPLVIPAESDIEAQALATGGGGALSSAFCIYLIDN